VPGVRDPCFRRQSPHVLRRGRRKVTVTVSLENREENAYNASVRLALSPNLLLASLTPRVQNLGCYPVPNVTLRMALPALGFQRSPFLSITRVLADNVSPPTFGGVTAFPPQDCGNAWCQELSCRLGRLERGGGASVQLLRSIHNEFFHGVRRGRLVTPPKSTGVKHTPDPGFSPPQAKFKRVKVVSSAWLGAPGSRLLVLQEGAQRREV
ncbi:ITA10 protein, partial [Alopecoenas beccarii]|nr:ITA10 protein [Alopecoenas beccarii]